MFNENIIQLTTHLIAFNTHIGTAAFVEAVLQYAIAVESGSFAKLQVGTSLILPNKDKHQCLCRWLSLTTATVAYPYYPLANSLATFQTASGRQAYLTNRPATRQCRSQLYYKSSLVNLLSLRCWSARIQSDSLQSSSQSQMFGLHTHYNRSEWFAKMPFPFASLSLLLNNRKWTLIH